MTFFFLEPLLMPPSRSGTLAALVLLGGLLVLATNPVGPLPALGAFFDPVHGVAGSVAQAELPPDATAAVRGLSGETRVVYDDRRVPHIFAPTIADAYRALGYVVARDRLFQIEVQTRAGGGTLTQLVGRRALPLDMATHESGMPLSAARRLAAYDTLSPGWALIRAYGEGVNAYIDALPTAALPFEYKLLGRRPRRWEPLDMFHLLNRMGQTLAVTGDELTQLQAGAVVGRAAAEALFPINSPIVEPIQPNGAGGARLDSIAIPPPGLPDSSAMLLLDAIRGARVAPVAAARSNADAVGSNNWAVAPRRSASGHALLAGDPHLELTLPSIWYEAHLVVPDSLDVYGVTIPGAPGVVIGFNRSLAWTFTNTGADVTDYYLEQVDDSLNPTRYRLDGEWKPLGVVVHEFRDQRGRVISSMTIRTTHRGPLRRLGGEGGRWLSMRWTVLEALHDFEGFDAAARAATAREMLDAMAATYGAPAQNMLVADTTGTIAIRSTGRYPIRPDNGRGDVLRDGSTTASDWLGDWQVSEYPQSFDPAQGFLASANQQPFDPRVQSRYLGANWERPWRAMRINTLLRADSAVTPEAMRLYQADPGSARADWFVPAFLAAAGAVGETQKLARAVALLGEWDRRYTPSNTRAVLFEEAMRQLQRRLWDEFRRDSTRRSPIPDDAMTAVLLRYPTSVWWDDQETEAVETRDELLAQVLETALDSVTARHGAADSEQWRWDRVRHANIDHLLGLNALSRRGVVVQGGPATLWPSSGNGKHGPSWRMVVELGGTPRAWATYPGGQSGNPLSVHYDDRIDQWSRGELDSLRVPRTLADLASSQQSARLLLVPWTTGGSR